MTYIRVIKGIPYKYRSERRGNRVYSVYLGRADGRERFERTKATGQKTERTPRKERIRPGRATGAARVKEEGLGEKLLGNALESYATVGSVPESYATVAVSV